MGIKSFQGRKVEPEKVESKAVRVADYMVKDIITFRSDQTIYEVMELLIKNNISGGCVVDKKNNLLGVISKGDCLKHISDSKYFNMPIDDISVEKRMTSNVDTIDVDMSLLDAAKKFVENHFRLFPVTEKGKLVGQISESDVIRAALNLRGQNWHS